MISKEEKLIGACMVGEVKEVQSLVSSGADVNWQDPDGFGDTALSQAALKGHMEIVKFLTPLSDQYSKDLALIFSTQKGEVGIMTYLLKNGANINANYFENYPPPIFQSIMQNKIDAFRCLAGWQGINLNLRALQDASPLLLAAFNGRLDMVEILTKKHVETGVKNKAGKNCREIAQMEGHQDVVAYLEFWEKNKDHSLPEQKTNGPATSHELPIASATIAEELLEQDLEGVEEPLGPDSGKLEL